MGSYVSVLIDTNDTILVKFTANNTAIASAGVIVATLGTIATGGAGAPFFLARGAAMGAGGIINYGVTLSQQLKADGYQELAPGEKHTSSKWSLSLLMSANIVKKKENGAELGSMSVWTAPTDGNTYEYNASACSLEYKSYT